MNKNAQFEFNGKKLYDDYDFILTHVDVGYPDLNRVTQTVPFFNGTYDFTDLYGYATWSERILTVRVRHKDDPLSRVRRNACYDNLSFWLLSQTNSKLAFDHIRGYFTGRVTKFSSKEAYEHLGYIEIEFTCHPFRTFDYYEGNPYWDPFCFETDILQDTKFDVNGTKEVNIYNLSATSVIPKVICDTDMTVVKGNVTYNFKKGESEDYRFMFNPHENKFTIKGNGTIEFLFRKMVI